MFLVRLGREDEVDKNEKREDQALNEADEDLETDEWQREPGNEEECTHHDEHDFSTEHISPETKRERQHPEELAGELDQPDEHEDDPHANLGDHAARFREAGQIDPPLHVREPIGPKALGLVHRERDDREAEIGVVIGGGRMKPRDLTDERDDRQPVRRDEKDEQSSEEREVLEHAGSTDALDE